MNNTLHASVDLENSVTTIDFPLMQASDAKRPRIDVLPAEDGWCIIDGVVPLSVAKTLATVCAVLRDR